MKIEQISVTVFNTPSKTVSDTDGHTHPGAEHDSEQAMLTITTDDGDSGYAFGSPENLRPHLIDNYVKKVFMGEDPMNREKLWINLAKWQRGSANNLTDRTLAVAETALWDLAGRALNTPVWKMLGGYRDKVLAYGSTMCGDEMDGGLATPEDYASYAEWMVERGYKAIKLHTWMPPVAWAPSVKMDIKALSLIHISEPTRPY